MSYLKLIIFFYDKLASELGSTKWSIQDNVFIEGGATQNAAFDVRSIF